MNRSRAIGVILFSTTWALLGLGAIVVSPATDWQATVGVLMISQAFSGTLAWDRFRKTAAAVLPDFLTMLLFMQFITKLLTAMGLVIRANPGLFGEVGEDLFWRESVPMEYQFQAELVFLLSTIIVTLIWRLLEGRTPLAVWREPPPGAMWWTYAFALAAYVALAVSPEPKSFGASLELMKMFSIGALAVLLGGRTGYALGGSRSWLCILALAPLYLLALRTGMKGDVLIVSMPFLFPIVQRLNANRAMALGVFVVAVVLFVFPFSQAWREANWSVRGQTADVPEVASEVYSRWQRSGLLETAAAGTASWLARGSSAEQGGLVIMLADQDGLLGPVLMEGLATIFVPRFLWPDKPLYQPGAWFTWYLGGAESPETATTSTAMMLPTELYWMFGISGVVIGMALIAMLYFYIWKFLLRRSARGLFPLVALFALLARSGGGLEEIHTIYAISGPIILVVYVVLFDYAQRLFTLVLAGGASGGKAGSK